jgi:hypothetical protein
MLCICSPTGQEEFFKEIGIPVATRTTPPPKVDAAQEAAFFEKVIELAAKYRTELVKEAKAKRSSASRFITNRETTRIWPRQTQ